MRPSPASSTRARKPSSSASPPPAVSPSHSLSFRTALTSALLALAVVSAFTLFSLLPPSSSTSKPAVALQAQQTSLPARSNMSLQKQRAVAAVVGGFVADAATMGLHWIYDADKLRALVAAAPAPEFHEPPSCPFYEYKSGALSPYGDEVLPLLEFVAAKGTFEPAGYAEASYQAAKHYTGRLNGVFRELVKKGDAGERYPHLAVENKDLHGGIKTPVLVAKYLGSDTATLVAKTKEATQVHQIGEDATDAAVASALLLQQLVEGVAIPTAVKALTTSEHIGSGIRSLVQDVLDAVESKTFPDATAAIDSFGKSCPLPGSLKGALYVLLTTSGYTAAVRTNLVAGGDNCSRSILIGACAAAAQIQDAASADPVPADWKAKTTQFDHVQQLAQQLVQ